jgi:hypothetical protein
VVQQMVENSISVCQTGPVNSAPAAYAERLTKVLNDVPTSSLKTLQQKNITVCLDQRLQTQKDGFWESTVSGVFYPGKDGGGIMTWRDNGMQPAQEGFWNSNPSSYYGSDAVDKLAQEARNGKLPGPGGYMTGDVYGSKSHYADWDRATTVKGALATNPQLQQPPVKAPAPAVKPAS